MTTPDPDDLDAEAQRVIAAAQALPDLAAIRVLAGEAVRHGTQAGMSIADVRRVAAEAIDHAEQVAALLRQLTGMLADDPPDGGGT